jgi:hypothetical protein
MCGIGTTLNAPTIDDATGRVQHRDVQLARLHPAEDLGGVDRSPAR